MSRVHSPGAANRLLTAFPKQGVHLISWHVICGKIRYSSSLFKSPPPAPCAHTHHPEQLPQRFGAQKTHASPLQTPAGRAELVKGWLTLQML